MSKLKSVLMMLLPLVLLLACGGIGGSDNSGLPLSDAENNDVKCASGAVEINMLYAPESELYLDGEVYDALNRFNQAYIDGRNPITGDPLASGEQPICVKGQPASSGQVAQGIINAIIAPNNSNVAKPTLFSPSVSHWLALVNFQTGRQIFDLADSPPTALAPVVMAIWESRLKAIQEKEGTTEVGWAELLRVLNSPNGWADYNIPGNRTTVYYGHTDPFISSTALSTLIAEFYASARENSSDPNFRRLTLEQVNDPKVQQGVRNIEELIRHYSSRTTEFKEYIAQGPNYLDFVALEENDLIFINQGKTIYQPPEKLVALYPKEGTFWHEHPYAIPQADWVTDEQRAAAKVLTEYIRGEEVQQKVLESGFRPVNPSVSVGYPISPELGVDPNQPTTVLEVPDPEVVAQVQSSWQFVKKQADVLLVIDTSGSMSGDKIEQAKAAANVFLDGMPPQNRVGLVIFDSQPQVYDFNLNSFVYADSNSQESVEPLVSFEGGQSSVRTQINALEVGGDTSLYDAIAQSIALLKGARDSEDDRIQSIVVLSDGQDTSSLTSLQEVVEIINANKEDRNPVIVIPVAYGGDADINSLNNIARASATRVQSGDPENIQQVLELISSYF
ncbi:MAG: substrate-binding domain-containing protein [Anaerolineaceae bacterium]|nr:substrate-binding domain-containing protein [Anaerolineaceae bacterium]